MDWVRAHTTYFLCGAMTLTYCAFFVGLATILGDPHMANRGGALLSAFGAAAVVWQVSREMNLEIKNATDESAVGAKMPPLAQETIERIVRGRYEMRRLERMKVVITIAGILVIGELMHGWADYLVPERHQQAERVVLHSDAPRR